MSFSLTGNIDNQFNADPLASSIQGQINATDAVVALSRSTPWKNLNNSRFFFGLSIDPARWDKFFPYRLLVIKTDGGSASDGGYTIVQGPTTAEVEVSGGIGQTTINFKALGNPWAFQLPISPQQLSIQDQFAINTSATLRGIAEEHSGVRFKMINCQGTMGVWPYRGSIEKPPTSPTPLQSIFGGTIESFGSLASQVQSVINTATTGHPANKPTSMRPAGDLQLSTGYYHAMALQQFLEQYAEAKKNPKNAGWRLVFDIPKQNQSFVVTPTMFSWQQNVNKPMEIMYSLQFKAWRRIDLNNKPAASSPQLNQIDPGILQRIMNTVSEARTATSAATNLIGAVRSDVEAPLDILRQTTLLVKDLAGVAITAADLPFQIQRDYASEIKQSLLNVDLSTASTNPAVRANLASVQASHTANEGLSLTAIQNGQLGAGAATAQSIDPSNNVFQNPEQNFSLMDLVSVNDMNLNSTQQNKLNNIVSDARTLTVDDLRTFRATVQELALQLSNKFGAGDAFFSQVYNRPAPTTRIQAMTVDEYDILKTLYDTIQCYDILTATTAIDDANRQTNMEYVAGLAAGSDIAFQVPTSKILAPVPFGLTIEEIAMRYLGDPQRWLEIVTLNNLRNPYIDENGFQLSLLSNASGRQLTVSSSENLYIGQRVIVCSASQVQSPRVILGIDKLSDTSFLITLDGEGNLDNFLISDRAYLQAYLPGTVNSQQKIFIPSNLSAATDGKIVIPASVAKDPLVGLSKVDWLLTDKGDLAVNAFGDFRYAAGMTNIIQALRIKFGTKKGKFLFHPEFGLGLSAGMMNSDIDVNQIYNSINKLVQEDPRFSSVESLRINLNGPQLTVSLSVSLAGIQGIFPVTFQLAS